MLAKFLGLAKVNFTNPNGEMIKGNTIYCAFKDENVEGLKTERFFLKEGIEFPECKINDNIELVFNMRGKVEMIRKA